jgi:hypothetical protein
LRRAEQVRGVLDLESEQTYNMRMETSIIHPQALVEAIRCSLDPDVALAFASTTR